MNYPLISIILCTWNGEKFLKKQVDSLLAQTYPNIEIIISDDASKDSTVSILKKYEALSDVRVFYQKENLGMSRNFEFALRQVHGEFIAFSDQDDIWLPEKIMTLYKAIGDSLLVYSDSELIDEEENSLHKKLSMLRRMYSGTQTRGFIFSNVVWGHTMLINRKLLSFSLPLPRDIPHDIWMGFKAATISGIKYLDLTLAQYRQHAATATKTIAVKKKTKTRSQKRLEFQKKLEWIGIMRDHELPGRKGFYEKLYLLWSQKKSKFYSFPLLFFLFRYRKDLFMFTRKKWVSQVVDIINKAKGVSFF